jgi:hypothetical protein
MPREEFWEVIKDEKAKSFEVVRLSKDDTALIDLVCDLHAVGMEEVKCLTCPATKTQKEVEDGMRSIGYTLDHDLYSRLLLEHRRTNKRTRL